MNLDEPWPSEIYTPLKDQAKEFADEIILQLDSLAFQSEIV